MTTNIGANIGSMDTLRDAAEKSAEAATEFHATAEIKAGEFQDEINQLSGIVQKDMVDFGDQVQQEGDELLKKVQETEWQGMAKEAKDARAAEMQGQITAFRESLDDGVEKFRTALTSAIEEFYGSIANDCGKTIKALSEAVHEEAKHTDATARALEEIDAKSAGL